MNKNKLVICDHEQQYAHQLMEYLTGKRIFGEQIQVCTRPESVRTLENWQQIDLLLISDTFDVKLWKQLNAKNVMVLYETVPRQKEKGILYVYKYQSADLILEKIMSVCQGLGQNQLAVQSAEAFRLIGIYSPIHRIGKTGYAISLGKELAKTSRTLYLNLDIYDAGGIYFPEETKKNLEDVLYFARQDDGNMGMWLGTAVEHMGGLDYVAPMRVGQDIKSVTGSDWERLFTQLERESMYDVVVLDIGECVRDIPAVLRRCTEIRMPVVKDMAGRFKVQQFQKNLKLLKEDRILERIEEYDLGRDTSREDSEPDGFK